MEFDSFVLAAATDQLASLQTASQYADAVEFRLDLSDRPRAQLRSYSGSLPIIATNRCEDEGGNASDGPARRERLAWAIEQPAVEAVDIELAVLDDPDWQALTERAQETGVSVIVSTHDFERTPSVERMRETLRAAGAVGSCAKLAVTARSRRDVIDLLTVTEELTAAGQHVATMAMGTVGQHSRAVAPLYGSRIGYAPLADADATAPGQYTLETLAELVSALGLDH